MVALSAILIVPVVVAVPVRVTVIPLAMMILIVDPNGAVAVVDLASLVVVAALAMIVSLVLIVIVVFASVPKTQEMPVSTMNFVQWFHHDHRPQATDHTALLVMNHPTLEHCCSGEDPSRRFRADALGCLDGPPVDLNRPLTVPVGYADVLLTAFRAFRRTQHSLDRTWPNLAHAL